jgi:mono/diheme cytochrome c family protein
MKKSKIYIVMIAVLAIGLFGLPGTFSVNTGQHIFKQINPDDPDTFCNQCHGGTDSVATEISLSDTGIYSGLQIHSTQNCGDCHQLTQGYGNSTGSTKTEHAAIIPSCLKCHGAAAVLGFNVANELNGTKEAHKPFWTNSLAANTPDDANTDDIACLGCHTAVPKSGSIVYDYTITHTTTLNGLTIGS